MQHNKGLELVAINDLADSYTLCHLLKYDSVHRAFPGSVTCDPSHLIINGHKVSILNIAQPALIPWKEYDIDVVVESTGNFTKKKKMPSNIWQPAHGKLSFQRLQKAKMMISNMLY